MPPTLHKVARFADLSAGRGTRVCVKSEDKDAKDIPILLVRDGENVRAYTAKCPHAGGPLDEGAICNGRIVCPWHKGTFDVGDGSLVEPPPLKALTRYEVMLKDGDVYVSAQPMESGDVSQKQTNDSRTMLIVGAGAAGAAACSALREAGFGGRIVLVGGDAREPYDRTSLSKFTLAGDMPPDDVPPLLDDDFFAKHDTERNESPAVHLDAKNRRVELANGHKIDYDAALVCTGGVPKPLTMTWNSRAMLSPRRVSFFSPSTTGASTWPRARLTSRACKPCWTPITRCGHSVRPAAGRAIRPPGAG